MADPAEEPRAVTSTRAVDIVVSLLLLAFAALMGWDNWKSGAGWASDGPKAGYFPFYLSLLLAAASVYGLVKALVDRKAAGSPFINRDELRAVLQVMGAKCLYGMFTIWRGLQERGMRGSAGLRARG